MDLIDLIMYINYLFASKTLGRDKSDAKWTAYLLTSLYFSMVLSILVCIFGLLFSIEAEPLLKKESVLFGFSPYLVSPILLAIRYYLNKGKLYLILNNLSQKSEGTMKLIRKSIYVIMILIPILYFCISRLYLFGQIKWW